MSPLPLKIIFAGTPEFTLPTLQTILDSQHQLIAVLTQPDKPAGRGHKLTASPAKQWALKNNIPVMQPSTLRDAAIQQVLRDLQPDVIVVTAYGLLLPTEVLSIPRFGCINIHPSLLPRWRGASPIQSAILNGDVETGVTIMQMERGMDSGPMLHKVFTHISQNDTAKTMHDRLASLGAAAVLETLNNIRALQPQLQDPALVTHAHKIAKEDANIPWEKDAQVIDRMIRAYNPWPIAFTTLDDVIIRIHQASVVTETSLEKPGTIINTHKDGIDVATGKNIVRLETLQLPGGKILTARELLNSKKDLFQIGKQFHHD